MSDPARTTGIYPEGGARAEPGSSSRVRRGAIVLSLVALLTVLLLTRPHPAPGHAWVPSPVPPGPLLLDTLVATGGGFALLSGLRPDGVALWHTADGFEWRPTPVRGRPSAIVVDGEELLTFDGTTAVRLVPDREGWDPGGSVDLPQPIRIGYATARPGLTIGRGGYVAQAITGDVLWSADGGRFELAIGAPGWGAGTGMPDASPCAPPASSSLEMPPLIAARGGFIALISATDPFGVWPVCEPEVWRSPDGRIWTRSETGSPFGKGAFVYDVAERDGRYLAVGGVAFDRPALWVSEDAREWSLRPPPTTEDPIDLRRLRAGVAGWVLLGEYARQPGTVGWVSEDGECWEPLPVGVTGRVAAVGGDQIMVGARTPLPSLWLASTDVDRTDCA